MKTKAFPPKFNSFAEALRFFAHNDPNRTLLIYEEDGTPVKKSRADFAASVFARAEEMRAFGMTCLGVLCDGSLDCVETIFASAVAGLQTVLLDENADDTLLQEQIRQTDIDILWSSDPDLVEELTPYLTDGITPRAEAADPSVEGSDILFFTSGTTASSKAVVLTDRSLLTAAYNGSCMLPLSQDDTLLCMLPLNPAVHASTEPCVRLRVRPPVGNGMRRGCSSWSGRKVLYHGLRILQADGPLCRSASSEFPRAAQTDEQRTPSRSRGSRRLLSPAVKQRGTAGRTGQFRLRADGDKFRRRDQRAGQSLLRPLCAGNLS